MEFETQTGYGTAKVRLTPAQQRNGGLELLGYYYPYGFFMLTGIFGAAGLAAAIVFRYKPVLLSLTGVCAGAFIASKTFKIESVQDGQD